MAGRMFHPSAARQLPYLTLDRDCAAPAQQLEQIRVEALLKIGLVSARRLPRHMCHRSEVTMDLHVVFQRRL